MIAEQKRRDDLSAALQIDGWLTKDEAEALYDFASASAGPIVEVGSWKGRSTSAIALGSMAGTKQPVYAVDSFKGIQPGAFPTAQGHTPGWGSSSPELLRENLDKLGINGQVTIIAKPSGEAANAVPDQLGMVFIDGDHEYSAVARDFALYLPRLRMGGVAVIHDVMPSDMGVVKAFDEYIMSDPLSWRVVGRVDSAMIIQRCKVERRNVLLACPGNGFKYGMILGIVQASLGAHSVRLPDTNGGTGWDDFNALWAIGLNMAEAGEITHFAMLHSDVVPDPGWLDILIGEMEHRKADMVSTAIAIKDKRGLTSCGIGDLQHRWGAFRRFTVRELMDMPPTFGIRDTQYPDKVLLHNTGCWVCDLRSPLFFTENPDKSLKCFFDFPTRVTRGKDGKWVHSRESEDWFFSRQLHTLGAKTFITRKVHLRHRGDSDFVNFLPWGTYKDGDEDTAPFWKKES